MDRRSLVLVALVIGTLMSAIDTTIVILALPSITHDLHSSLILTIWVIIIYLLIIAVMTTQLGGLGDIYGRAKIFNTGFLVFILGSALCGASPDIYYLLGFRAIQAVGASLMQANSSAIVADTFEPEVRGRAFGFTTLGWNIGGVLGIVLGGIITTFIGWRYIFYINVPIGLVGFAIGLRVIKSQARRKVSIDIAGMLLLAAILSTVAYGAVYIAGHGFRALNIGLIALGLVLIAPFVYQEKRAQRPVINPRAFRVRTLTFSLMATLFQATGYLSVVFLLIMYLQGIKGYSPLDSSLILVPGYVIASLFAPRMGRLSDRVGARMVATVGIILMAIGVLVYITLRVSSPYYVVIIGSLVTGFGAAMFWPSNNSAVMSSSPPELYGSSGGLMRTLSNIGTIISYVLSISIASLTVSRTVAYEVFLGVIRLGSVSSQFLVGIRTAFIASVAILALAGIFSFVRGHGHQVPQGTPEGTGKR